MIAAEGRALAPAACAPVTRTGVPLTDGTLSCVVLRDPM